MRVSDVKREYQLREWSGMLRECKESGLTVKNWCAERGITEHAYYYRLRKLRQAACDALQQAQPVQLAEIPLYTKGTGISGTAPAENPGRHTGDCERRP